jgi:large subunit ribosomal protein L31
MNSLPNGSWAVSFLAFRARLTPPCPCCGTETARFPSSGAFCFLSARISGREVTFQNWPNVTRKDEDSFMKPEIHPQYQQVNVHCACGETWTTSSTKKELRLEICSKCHPFFTGRQKLVDSAGQVARFNKKYAKKD